MWPMKAPPNRSSAMSFNMKTWLFNVERSTDAPSEKMIAA